MALIEDNGWYDVVYECDSCQEVKKTQRGNYRRMLENSGGTFCRPCAAKRALPKLMGRVPWNKGRATKPENAKPYIASDGYWVVWDRVAGSYTKLHRVVAANKLGRKLLDSESVHHINGNRLDNHPDNLWVCDSHAGHRLAHQSLQEIGYQLVMSGLLSFSQGQYVADVKLRELLGQPEAANQQPSQDSNDLEGSETRSESHADNNSP